MPNDHSSDEAKDILLEAIRVMEDRVEYADALYERVQGVQISKDKAEERISAPASAASGLVLRAYKMGQWREAGTYEFSKAAVHELATKISRFQPISRKPVKLQELRPWKIDQALPVKVMPSEVETIAKLNEVRRMHAFAMSCDKRIINTTVQYFDATSEKIFANTEGSVLRQIIPRITLFVLPVAKEGGKVDYDYFSVGGTAGFERVKDLKDEKIKETVDSSISLLNASASPSGMFTVLLDPGMTGTFAHESFGHGCEADQIVRDRSYLVPYYERKMGSEQLSICDDGTFAGGNGSFLFDDEGVKSKKNYILKDGVLKNFLHERFSASLMNAAPTGNGRRESFLRKLFVRMTNTYIEPGDYSLDEMIEEVDNGVMLVNTLSGMEDPLAGGMELKSKKGFLIEKGKIGRVLSTLTLSERVPEFIASIDAIGAKDQFDTDTGTCGKGHEDFVPVGDGGVFIRGKAVVGQG